MEAQGDVINNFAIKAYIEVLEAGVLLGLAQRLGRPDGKPSEVAYKHAVMVG